MKNMMIIWWGVMVVLGVGVVGCGQANQNVSGHPKNVIKKSILSLVKVGKGEGLSDSIYSRNGTFIYKVSNITYYGERWSNYSERTETGQIREYSLSLRSGKNIVLKESINDIYPNGDLLYCTGVKDYYYPFIEKYQILPDSLNIVWRKTAPYEGSFHVLNQNNTSVIFFSDSWEGVGNTFSFYDEKYKEKYKYTPFINSGYAEYKVTIMGDELIIVAQNASNQKEIKITIFNLDTWKIENEKTFVLSAHYFYSFVITDVGVFISSSDKGAYMTLIDYSLNEVFTKKVNMIVNDAVTTSQSNWIYFNNKSEPNILRMNKSNYHIKNILIDGYLKGIEKEESNNTVIAKNNVNYPYQIFSIENDVIGLVLVNETSSFHLNDCRILILNQDEIIQNIEIEGSSKILEINIKKDDNFQILFGDKTYYYDKR